MTLPAGVRLGPYEIHSLLGAGGMGEVYRARDTRLGRDVAIKIPRRMFTSDPDRLARFEREARLLAALNHPNIAAIHGIEERDGVEALVLELVEGDTLAQRLQRAPVPVSEALNVARQIVDALDAAHEKGIVHRDLKPANIKITPEGVVKVLDFGIAKVAAGEDLRPDSSTATLDGTREGVILGTVTYMSPEQASGLAVDKRTDIWAFGCVLYEMLTGRVAFLGATMSDTIVAILERNPDWTALPATTPATVRRLLARCLDKDPKARLRDVGDAQIELREALAQSGPESQQTHSSAVAAAGKIPRRWMWGSVAVAGVALLSAAVLVLRPATQSDGKVRLSLAFEGLTGEGGTPVPSPDGKTFVFQAFAASGRRSLWLRPLDSELARPLSGTEDAEQPFWFPDGRWIGFYAQAKLKRVSPSGGSAQTIADVGRMGFANLAAANDKGDIVFSGNRSPLFRVRQSDGTVQQLTRLDSSRAENSHRFPAFLPDGRHFLFLARSGRPENNALYLGSLDSPETRRVMTVHSNVSYVPAHNRGSASLLYVKDGALVEQRFDGDKVIGEPNEIVENVEYIAPSQLARFAVSSDGTVLILHPSAPGRSQLQWFDRKGNALAALGPPGDYMQPRISPDGSRVLFSRPDAQTVTRDVWYMEASRGVAARLTTHQANDWWPVWSPDGRSIVFGSDRGGGPDLETYLKRSTEPGSGETRLFDFHGVNAVPQDWSHDGNWIAFQAGGAPTGPDVWIVPTSGQRTPFAFLATPFYESNARFSQDDHWMAYTSNESGRYEVYVRPFAGAAAGPSGKMQVSSTGGDFVVWSRKELFFIGSDLKLYSVQMSDFGRSGATPQPVALFTPCQATVLAGLPMRATPFNHPYDVSSDGQQFLINCSTSNPGRFDVLLNWARGPR